MRSGSDNLRDALRALGGETRAARTPERVHAALVAEMRRRARRRRLAAWWPAAAAAAVLMAVGAYWGLGRGPMPAPVEQVVVQAPPVAAPAVLAEPNAAAPAAAIESKARLVSRTAGAARRNAETPWFFYAGYPRAENGQVVSIKVNAATAAQFGVYSGGVPVAAQVFIGDDGLARAIRFVR